MGEKAKDDRGRIEMSAIEQMKFARGYTLGQLEKLDGADWDARPDGFNNNVRWNAGHIFVSQEGFTKAIVPDYEIRKPEWNALFGMGTKPADWTGDVPSNEELMDALKEQTGRIAEALEGKLDRPLAKPMTIGGRQLTTGDDLVQLTAWHEGMHSGILNAFAHILRK